MKEDTPMKTIGCLITAMAISTGIFNVTVDAAEEREGTAAVPKQANANPESEVYRASEVIGLTVNDDKDQEVGQIKDLVINGASREVLYAVVALNEGKEKDAVYVMPWSVFQPHFGQGSALQYTVLTVPQTVWIQAPYWPMAQWRQASFTQWGPRVDQYFAKHVHVNSTNRNSTIQTNKPVLKDDQRPDSTSPKTKTEGRSNDSNPRKPAENNDSSTDKPKAKNNEPAKKSEKPDNEPAKKSEKPGNKPAEPPAAKTPQLPAPKNPDPVDPKPAPRTEKPAPKNPK